jgi:hypothetical protein
MAKPHYDVILHFSEALARGNGPTAKTKTRRRKSSSGALVE